MFEQIWSWIKKLFKIGKTYTSDKQQAENQKYADEYTDISKINFNAIFSNKLATLATSDSTAEIAADNKRAELLNNALQDVWDKLKKTTASALGVGGCILVPYVSEGKILFNTVKQNRMMINGRNGDKITGATILADSVVINNNLYYRFTNYTVEGNTLYITNKTTNASGGTAVVEQWENIPDMAISNVDRALFGFIKSPVDNRKSMDDYGVPITYGCGEIMEDIRECLKQIRKEYKLKGVRLQVDDRTLDKDPKTGKPILKDNLFMMGHSEKGELFNIFDPEIRDSSFYARLNNLFELLEKQVGTSKGILTAPETHGATATEIRAAVADTFAMVGDIRKAIEKGIEDYIYACDVLANYYNLTPPGEYEIKYDWSYAMVESTNETWQQMKDLQGIGGLSKAELRAWQTGEDLETAQSKVDEITAKEPSLHTLLGMDEGSSTPPETMKTSISKEIDDTVTKQLNGAQTQSLINIVMQYKQGVLTEGQAINIISTSIGVSKDQATELLRA